MIQSISLIQAIILLDKKEVQSKSAHCKHPTIESFELTPKNIAKATELIRQTLGRDLHQPSLLEKVFLLIIETMVEKQSALRKVDRSDFRFTRKDVRTETSWSEPQVQLHLGRLTGLHFVSFDPSTDRYKLLYNGRRVSKVALNSHGILRELYPT
ncbi:MAG TPA: hypothetical protein VGO47_04090 [Chlamydiales bacterium]|nr:hypothetical protein [Chlamydiales bacterium]